MKYFITLFLITSLFSCKKSKYVDLNDELKSFQNYSQDENLKFKVNDTAVIFPAQTEYTNEFELVPQMFSVADTYHKHYSVTYSWCCNENFYFRLDLLPQVLNVSFNHSILAVNSDSLNYFLTDTTIDNVAYNAIFRLNLKSNSSYFNTLIYSDKRKGIILIKQANNVFTRLF
jgi:hypothetical protein